MSNLPQKKSSLPGWVWLSMIPGFGGLAIVYQGKRLANKIWLLVGVGVTFLALAWQGTIWSVLIWLSQVGLAFWFNQSLEKKAHLQWQSNYPVDINTCSKHDLVYKLNLPIVYANDIEELKQEGYIFTYLEELKEIAGLPDTYLRIIAPLVTFSYDINREIDTSWRRFNSCNQEELINLGLTSEVAAKIIKEREGGGIYRSVIDLRNRTGIPLKTFEHLI